MSPEERLPDAIQRLYPVEQRPALEDILIVGARQRNEELVRQLAGLFPAARFTVFDPNPSPLRLLEEALADLNRSLETLTGSPDELVRVAPGPYQLACLRHPDVVLPRSTWEDALRASTDILAPGGRIFVTTDQLADAAYIDQVLDQLGWQMVPGTPYTAVPVALTGLDRYILIYESTD